MSAEFATKLLSMLQSGNRQPTPSEIQKYIEQKRMMVGMEGKIDGELPQVLLSEFIQGRVQNIYMAATNGRLRRRDWYAGHRPIASSRNNKGR